MSVRSIAAQSTPQSKALPTQPAEEIDRARAMADLYAGVSERDWQATVEELLALGGWDWIHLTDSRRQRATGWPDLFAVRRDERLPERAIAIAIELKTERGRTTAEQERWLALLADAGVQCYVWRPRDREEARRVLLGHLEAEG